MSNPFSFSHEDEEDDFGGALEGGSPKNSRSRTTKPRPEAIPVAAPVRNQPAGKPVRSTPAAKPAQQKRVDAPARQQPQPTRAPAPRRAAPTASAVSPSAPRRAPAPSLPAGRSGGLPTGAGAGQSRLAPPVETAPPARRRPPVREPEPETYEDDHYEDDHYDDSSDDSYGTLEDSFQQQQQREDALVRRNEEHARKVERQRQREREREREEQRDEEDDFDPNDKKGKKTKKKAAKDGEKKARNRGGRGQMLAVRYTVIGIGVILMGFGVKSIVFPPDIPPTDVLTASIQAEMNMSAFPADQAESFILGFTRAYLNYDPALSAERNDALEQFTKDANAVNGLTVPSEYPQAVVEGPYISGVRYVDDNNALFTTTAKLDNGRWVSIATPVFYDDTARSFVVAQSPSLAPNPQLAASTGKAPDQMDVDDEATESASATVASFMKAWGASDSEALSVVITDGADPRVWNGLEGTVQLDRVDLTEVYAQPEDEASPMWQAKVDVMWSVTTTLQNDAEEGEALPEEHPRYAGSYQLLLQRSDDGKWYVADIIPAQYQGTPDPNAGEQPTTEPEV